MGSKLLTFSSSSKPIDTQSCSRVFITIFFNWHQNFAPKLITIFSTRYHKFALKLFVIIFFNWHKIAPKFCSHNFAQNISNPFCSSVSKPSSTTNTQQQHPPTHPSTHTKPHTRNKNSPKTEDQHKIKISLILLSNCNKREIFQKLGWALNGKILFTFVCN